MVVVGVVTLFAILAVNGVFSKTKEKPGPGRTIEDKKENVVRSNLPELLMPEPSEKKNPAQTDLKPFEPKVIRTSDVGSDPSRSSRGDARGKQEMTPEQRKRQGGLFADLGGERTKASTPAQTAKTEVPMTIPTALPVGGGFSTGQEEEEGKSKPLDDLLAPTEMQGVSATLLPDRNFLVTQGTFIDCALETAISSDVPGFVSCRSTRDVYSTNGRVLLLERGSKIVGQYQGGLQRGIARIFALWSRIETPSGVIVSLNSPGTDALGRSGHEGYIDTHFWERFGGAILMSIIDDFGNYITAKAADSDGVQIGSTTGSAQEAGSIALENSINIRPTLYKNQGEHISIFVARDLDFRGVYDVAAAE
jgi:type IV secretion system protein VirB10